MANGQQTYSLCGTGPQALASCICLKSGLSGKVSRTLTESVKEYCSSTAINHVTSAVAVFDYYCSAAANKAVAKVEESISESLPASRLRTGSSATPSETGSSGNGGASGSNGSGSSGSNGSNGSGGSGGGTNKTAAIVGGVLGGVVLVAIAVGLYFFFRHRSRKSATLVTAATGHPGMPQEQKYAAAQELSTPSRTPQQDLHGGSYNNIAELPHGQYSRQERAELPGSFLTPSQPPSYQVSPQSPPTGAIGQPPSALSWSHDGRGYGQAM